VALEHIGIPTLAALVQAVAGLRECGAFDEVDIVIMGGIRNGSDAAKALAMGAKAVAIGTAALIAMGCTACMQCATGKCPKGIATQDKELRRKFDIDEAAEGVANFIESMNSEMKLIARVCGKTDVHNLEPEDLRALTLEASAITGIPLVGSDMVVGSSGYSVLGSRDGHGNGASPIA
jgi:glutamate synthase domain-containing protein 2